MNEFFSKLMGGSPSTPAMPAAPTPATIGARAASPAASGDSSGFTPPPAGDSAKSPMLVGAIPASIRSKLPKAAAEKLAKLQKIRDEARKLFLSYGGEIAGLDRELAAPERDLIEIELRFNINRTNREAREKRLAPNDRARLDHVRQKVKTIRAEKAEIFARRDAHGERQQGAAALIRSVEDYVVMAKAPLESAPEPKFAKSTTLEAALKKILDLQADLHAVRSAALPAKDAKAVIDKFVDDLAEEGLPDTGPSLDHAEPPRFPERYRDVEHYGTDAAMILRVPYNPLWPALAWLDADRLKKRLCEEIDLCANDAEAISAEDKRKREAELKDQILEAERAAAAIAWAMDEPWRLPSDLDVRALIGVSGPAPAAE